MTREEAAAQRARRLGRLTAPERIDALVDAGSFASLKGSSDGILAGVARVDARDVIVIAHDPAVRRGGLGAIGARQAAAAVDIAMERGVPVLWLADSDGARVEEAIDAVTANAILLDRLAQASGRVPLLWSTFGLAGGAAGYGAALCDLIVGVRDRSFAFITGPQVIRAVTGEDVSLEAIGGTAVHATRTGLLHGVAEDERAALAWLKRCLSYLPSNAWSQTAASSAFETSGSIAGLVPDSPRQAYDVRKVIAALFDSDSFFELAPEFARNLVTGFARLGGVSVGVVASQAAHLGGVLDVTASVKGARFVRFCTAFNLPIVTLVDSPGFLPGAKQEQAGLLLHGAKLVSAYSEARGSTPLISFILRRSCGAASVLSYGADVVLALTNARVQTMGVDALMTVAHGPDLADVTESERAAQREELARLHEDPKAAVVAGYVHRLIAPEDARVELLEALRRAGSPRPAAPRSRKLSNLPL